VSPKEVEKRPTIVVSGLPRSGTSLMMQLLERAGVPLLSDDARPPDVSNPRGYFEFAPVKGTLRDASWVSLAEGRAVKVIHALLQGLPTDRRYRVLLMRRPIEEIVQSQDMMLARLEEPPAAVAHARLAQLLEGQLEQAQRLLEERACFEWLEVDYRELVRTPEILIPKIGAFLGIDLPLDSLLECIDPGLYRNRSQPTAGSRLGY